MRTSGRNVAWSYDRRYLDAAQIHGLISFFNERVDLTVAGVLQPRPVTPWSRHGRLRRHGQRVRVKVPPTTTACDSGELGRARTSRSAWLQQSAPLEPGRRAGAAGQSW